MKVTKRLTFCALFALCTLYANAYDFYTWNDDDGIIYYNYVDKSKYTLEVTFGNIEYSGDVIIPETIRYGSHRYTIVGIAKYAFSGCSDLTSVTIPNSVTSIGDCAFYWCSSLTNIEVAEDNQYYCDVDGVLFSKDMTTLIQFPTCSPLLPSYNVPDGVETIGDYAFYECEGLTSVNIPHSVTTIDRYAFYECEGLTSLTLGNSLTTIGDRAFYKCICLADELKIPDSVKTIEDYAFFYCWALSSLTLGNSVETIGRYAFGHCDGLTGELKIPDSVTEIGEAAFSYCSRLTGVNIPNSVTSIGDYAFEDCSGLTELKIPDSVTTIGNSAFYDCSGLTGELKIPDSVETIGLMAFQFCTGLTSVTIGNGLIGQQAFYHCYGLKKVTIGDGVINIGRSAFYYCTDLTSVTIGSNVNTIENNAFGGCSVLAEVLSLNPTPPSCATSVFSGVDTSTCVLYVPNESIDTYSTTAVWEDFYNTKDIETSGIETLTPDGAEIVGYYGIDGKQLNALQKGINVVRYSDGTTKKVLVE